MLKTLKKILLVLIALMLFVFIYMLFEIEIIVIILLLSSLFHMFNIDTLGAYVFALLSLLGSLLMIKHVRSNIQKRNWKEQLVEKITYSLQGISKNSPKTSVIEFNLEYKTFQRIKNKIFRINIKNDNLDNAMKILKHKIGSGKLKAVIYSNPSKEGKITFQNEFTVSNYFQAPFVICTQIVLYLYTVYQANVGYQHIPYTITGIGNWSENILYISNTLNTSLLYYLILLNIALITIYIILLIFAAIKYGIKNYRSYPNFIDEGNEIKRNFIFELMRMNELCSTCGEIIEVKEDYCSNCGSIVVTEF